MSRRRTIVVRPPALHRYGEARKVNLVWSDRMAQLTEAIYTHGVLKPVEELALREDQRVRLVVEPLEDDSHREDRAAAMQRLRAGIEGMRFFSCGRLPGRDEL